MYIENGDTPTGCVPDKKTISLLCIMCIYDRYTHVPMKNFFLIHKPAIIPIFSFATPSVYVLRTRLKHLKGIETV